MSDPKQEYKEALKDLGSDSARKKSVDLGYEFLYLVALLVHLIDAFVLNFQITPQNIVIRLCLYFVVGLVAYYVLGRKGKMSVRTIMVLSAIPAVFAPLLQGGLGSVLGPSNSVSYLSSLLVFVPVWLVVLVAGNYTYRDLYFPTVVNATYYYFLFLLVVVMIYLIVTGGQLAAESGFETRGIDVAEGVSTGWSFITGTFFDAYSSTVGAINWTTGELREVRNDTLGQYYNNEVDDAPERLGVFVKDFGPVSRQSRADRQLIVDGIIEANAFRRETELNISCLLKDVENESDVVVGELGEDKTKTIREFSRSSFTCEFSPDKLEAGRYQVQASFEFDFETMASMEYAFITSDRARSILNNRGGGGTLRSQDVVARTVGVSTQPNVIYTGGPARMTFRGEDSLPVWIEPDEPSPTPLDVRLQNSPSMRGEGGIETVNAIDLRIPEEIDIVGEECRGLSYQSSDDVNVETYNRYVFDDIEDWYFDRTFELVCEVDVDSDDAQSFLGEDEFEKFTVASVANYTYVLEKSSFVDIEPSLEERG